MKYPIACIVFLLSLFSVALSAGRTLIICLAHYVLLVALLPLLLFAAETLTNADIITMVQGKVPQDVIIQKIADSDQRFQLTPGHLAQLASFGVPDDVIRAMGSKQNGGRFLSASPKSGSSSGSTIAGPPTEVGVYIESRGLWVELLPEIANFKTGGVAKIGRNARGCKARHERAHQQAAQSKRHDAAPHAHPGLCPRRSSHYGISAITSSSTEQF